jgi:hypothetical protein
MKQTLSQQLSDPQPLSYPRQIEILSFCLAQWRAKEDQMTMNNLPADAARCQLMAERQERRIAQIEYIMRNSLI